VQCFVSDRLAQTACDGGEAPGAYQTLINAGGMGTEASYPYLAQDGYVRERSDECALTCACDRWCNLNDHSSGVVVKGYKNVTGVPQLQSAIAGQPVAIAIDASLPSFRFYK
jgi:KDEL-tailed cysteine endopeptidase